MRYLLIAAAILTLMGCTSEGVHSKGNGIYSYEGIYLKHIEINGYQIFLLCDENGKLLPNNSTVNLHYKQGKSSSHSVTFIGL